MSPDLDTQDLTDDAVLGGRLSILQPRVGHRAGHDAILLAAATAATTGDHAVDFGAGVGTAGLALATRVAGVSVTLVDIDSNLVALARENAAKNRLADRVSAVTLDVAAPEWGERDLAPGSADHVLMNPPFNDASRQQVSPDARRRMAYCSSEEMLVSWIRTAGRILRPNGTVTLIFRADGIGEVLQALGAGFGAIAVRPIYGKPAASAIRILTRAVKSSRAPTSVRPGFLLNGADGRPTAEAEAVLRGAAALPFDPAE
jgi:tRNA1(Val) A37 N6-methylase TrmN6